MIRNYIKIALRNLKRYPGFTGINIVGMALGIACCVMAVLFLRSELTYDQFHENVDDIYRVTARFSGHIQFTVVPDPLTSAAIDEFPGVINGTRIWGSSVVTRQNNNLADEQANYVDNAFFDMFTFPVRYGVSRLNAPDEVVLTSNIAEKYFGQVNPVGRTLEMRLNDRFESFTVVGVLQPLPQNSSLQFDMLLPFEQRYQIKDESLREEWGSYGVVSFLQLEPAADTTQIKAQLLSLVEKHSGEKIRNDGEQIEDYAFLISPFAQHHLGGGGMEGYALISGTTPAYVYLLSLIAGLVLLIACFNFMNLSIGQASSRLKEIGVRKVVGAARKQLLTQFGFESLMLSGFAACLGVVLVYAALPYFNNLIDTQLVFAPAKQPIVLLVLITITLITAVLAGTYPALMLSRSKSIDAFKGKFKFGGGNLFTQSLVVLQFAFTALFLIGTVFVTRQHNFMREANLGYDEEQVLMIPVSGPADQPETGERLLARFQETLSQHPAIVSIAGTSNAFTQGNSATMKTLEDGRQEILYTYRVDDQFFETMDMDVTAGRNFDPMIQSDAQSGVIINESFAAVFGMEQPVGQVVPVDLVGIAQPQIIGVVKDFHFESLHSQIKPVFFHQRQPYKINFLVVKLAPEQIQAGIEALQETWMTFHPGYPFDFQFLDEVIQSQYQVEERWSKATQYASWIAILIASLGLLGLTSISMSKRTKEVGIRKVLGASVPGLVNLLSRQFIMLVAIANVIAWPAAYFALNWWLGDFSYQIQLGADVFLGVGLFTVLIAFLTISYQSIRAALADPVKSLKYE